MAKIIESSAATTWPNRHDNNPDNFQIPASANAPKTEAQKANRDDSPKMLMLRLAPGTRARNPNAMLHTVRLIHKRCDSSITRGGVMAHQDQKIAMSSATSAEISCQRGNSL